MPTFIEDISDNTLWTDSSLNNGVLIENIIDSIDSVEKFRVTPQQRVVIQNFMNDLVLAFSEGVDADGTEIVGSYPDFNLINILARGRIRNIFSIAIACLLHRAKTKNLPTTNNNDSVSLAPLSISAGQLIFTDGILTAATNPT